jgi:hypothetical protein
VIARPNLSERSSFYLLVSIIGFGSFSDGLASDPCESAQIRGDVILP